jgi:preprotein translocase subunit SecF
VFIISGIASLIMKGGPLLSIDFTGGTVVQVKFDKPVKLTQLRSTLSEYGFKGAEIIEFGSPDEVLIKTQLSGSSTEISEKLITAMGKTFTLRRVESVGPKIGKELQADALKAIGLALILILAYIAFRFDRYYALGSVVALIHDVLITLGVFSLLDYEINLSIVAAFLTIVGYSLNDTIVVFDRIRENIPKHMKKILDDVINISLNETLNRTVITSLTTLMVVVILFVWGGEVINLFSFALIVGVFIGTYSSLFVASPVMAYFEKRSKGQKRR